MQVSFYAEGMSEGHARIMVSITWAGERLRMSTGIKVEARCWHPKRYHSGPKTDPEAVSVRRHLSELTSRIMANHAEFLRKHERQPIGAEVRPWVSKPRKESMSQWMTRWVNESPQRVNVRSGRKLHPRTVAKYKTTLSRLLKYLASVGIPDSWQAVSIDVYHGYVRHLQSMGLGVNTIAKDVQVWKTMMADAMESGVHDNQVHRARAFTAQKVPGVHVALTEVEIDAMLGLELSGMDADIRDLFVVGCYTGLRWSDLKRINLVCYPTEKLIKLRTYKTDTAVIIPIIGKIVPMFEQRQWRWVVPSDQYFNRAVKKLARMAGITQRVERSTIRGGVYVTETIEKCEMISSHTGRRTFATVAYFRGAKPRDIMRITGHKTEQQCLHLAR